MGKTMKLLEDLQVIDLKLDAWHGEKNGLLGETTALEEQLETERGSIAAKQAEMSEVEQGKRELEENLAAETDNIARSEVRLKDIKTQKEYQAVSKEISAAKKITAELEEQVLQKISRMDELRSEIEAMEANLKLLEENISSRKTEILDKIEKLEESIHADVAERDSMIKGIQPALLSRYTKLRERRQGLAVVEAKNGSCLGCNMNLPPQVYNNLFSTENLITCPHCQRMLFLRRQDDDIQ